MSSHVRFVTQIDGYYFAGHQAKAHLIQRTGLPVKTVSEAIVAAKRLGVRIWIFREPRKIKTSKSRYKKYCGVVGIRKNKKEVRVQWVDPVFNYPVHPPQPAPPQPLPQAFYLEYNQGRGGQNGPAQPRPAEQVRPIAIDNDF